ncbi:hypothetical protein T484DRAFT_1813535 [Baffinella frigidus]|nr:hypothetical protein T484DRAFT_1813535 [Cryptophyta sp. CCMP2293]
MVWRSARTVAFLSILALVVLPSVNTSSHFSAPPGEASSFLGAQYFVARMLLVLDQCSWLLERDSLLTIAGREPHLLLTSGRPPGEQGLPEQLTWLLGDVSPGTHWEVLLNIFQRDWLTDAVPSPH